MRAAPRGDSLEIRRRDSHDNASFQSCAIAANALHIFLFCLLLNSRGRAVDVAGCSRIHATGSLQCCPITSMPGLHDACLATPAIGSLRVRDSRRPLPMTRMRERTRAAVPAEAHRCCRRSVRSTRRACATGSTRQRLGLDTMRCKRHAKRQKRCRDGSRGQPS